MWQKCVVVNEGRTGRIIARETPGLIDFQTARGKAAFIMQQINEMERYDKEGPWII